MLKCVLISAWLVVVVFPLPVCACTGHVPVYLSQAIPPIHPHPSTPYPPTHHTPHTPYSSHHTSHTSHPPTTANAAADRANAEAEQLHQELLRHESVLRAINDPYTAEGVISSRALVRLRALAVELELDAPHVVELAHQAAQILLLMRPQDEEASDFQVGVLCGGVCVGFHVLCAVYCVLCVVYCVLFTSHDICEYTMHTHTTYTRTHSPTFPHSHTYIPPPPRITH